MKFITSLTACSVFAAVVAFNLPASAIDLVAPNSLENSEGNGENQFPFVTTAAPQRYQQVYDASQFGTTPLSIEGIAFRLDDEFGNSFSTTIPDIEISLSTASADPDALSSAFADNIGADETVVFTRGSLPLSSNSNTPSGTPEAFDIAVDFTDTFFFDPNVGNLLLEVKNFSTSIPSSPIFFNAENTTGDSVSRLFNTNDANATTGFTDSLGLVTQFNTASTQPVPFEAEGTMGLVALGGYFSYRFYRKKRQQKAN